MAEITAAAVKSLRERTGLPMMKCKEALREAGGDEDAAVALLKKQVRGLKEKQVGRETSEGRIFVKIKDDGSAAAMVELLCESAPVAGNDDFVRFGSLTAEQLLEGPGAESAEELLQQPAPDESGQTLTDMLDDLINRIREKIAVNRVVRVDGAVAGYVHHDGKVGVLFQASGENATSPVMRDVAMHIAALMPTAVNPADLEPSKVQEERNRLTEEAKATGKPDNIIEKIVEGRLKNFYIEEGVLVLQPFAKDDTKSVSQALAEHGLKPKSFIRWKIGT